MQVAPAPLGSAVGAHTRACARATPVWGSAAGGSVRNRASQVAAKTPAEMKPTICQVRIDLYESSRLWQAATGLLFVLLVWSLFLLLLLLLVFLFVLCLLVCLLLLVLFLVWSVF